MSAHSAQHDATSDSARTAAAWNRRYCMTVVLLAGLWWALYRGIQPAAAWIVHDLLGLAAGTRLTGAVEFFLYDTGKILLLLAALIYGLALLRASLNVERVRNYLAGRGRGFGYVAGAVFGAVTPFCSCSSIPLFLGFTMARIPIGVTMAFLITSPLINELAVILLWGLLGWKFTLLYVLVGLTAGILGGLSMDSLKAGRWLQPFILETITQAQSAKNSQAGTSGQAVKLTLRDRHVFARNETRTIFKRVWKWVVLGVALGAGLHGCIPDNWFATYLGAGEWWSVPCAVLLALPLYSNVTGIIPIMESLLLKGLPVGTTMAFCMAAVVASIPEVMMLRQIMTIKLQAAFVGYLLLMFTLVGWLFNALGPFLF